MYVKPLRCAKGVTFVNIFKQFGAVYQLERVLCYSKGVSGSFYLSAPGSEVSVAGPACEPMHTHTHTLRGGGSEHSGVCVLCRGIAVCVCECLNHKLRWAKSPRHQPSLTNTPSHCTLIMAVC